MSDLYAFRQNAVVAASAGTGKTHALVGVLVHALLGLSCVSESPVEAKAIVATTFSRRAAAEIRDRIVSELEQIARDRMQSRYAADLDAALHRLGERAPSELDLRARARRALLAEGDMFVGTLHGWATRLVRSHATALGLPPTVNFIDEHEHLIRTLDVVGSVVDARYPNATRSIGALAEAAGSREQLVADLAQTLRTHEEDASSFAFAKVIETAQTITEIVNRVNHLLELMSADPDFGELARQAAHELRMGTSCEALDLLCNMSKWKSDAAKARSTAIARSELATIVRGDPRRRSASTFFAIFQRRLEFDACAHEAKAILTESQARLTQRAERDAAWSFGQVMRAAVELLRNEPSAAQALRESLQILVIDEFQDTSRLQADLIVHAWEESPIARSPGQSAEAANLRKTGLMLVGDRKQSIYGFRGADVSVFGDLAVALAGNEAARALKLPERSVRANAHFYALQINRRSGPRILQAANAFSRERMAPLSLPPEPFEIEYAPEIEDLHPPPQADNNAGRVEWLVSTSAKLATEQRVRNGDAIAARIWELLAEQPADLAIDRPVMFSDFAVLAANRRALDAVAYCFGRDGLPFVMSGNGFYAAQEVRDAVSLLRWLHDPEDTLSLLEMLRGPWLCLDDEALVHLCDDRGLPRSLEALGRRAHRSQVAELMAFVNVLDSLKLTYEWANPGTLLDVADRLLGLSDVVGATDTGEQKRANIEKLKERARSFATTNAFLQDFADRASREALELQASVFSDRDNAVRLLTVHASKGLDFPIVFWTDIADVPKIAGRKPVVATARTTGGRGINLAVRLFEPLVGTLTPPIVQLIDDIEKRRLLAERQRLDYVALTRAARALIFVGPEDRRVPETALAVATKLTPKLVNRVVAAPKKDTVPAVAIEQAVVRKRPILVSKGGLVAVTSLSDFQLCPRRYELKHEYQLNEPALGKQNPRLGGEHRASSVREGILLHVLLEHLPLDALGNEGAARECLSAVATRVAPSADESDRRRAIDAGVRFATSAYASAIATRSVRVEREWPFVFGTASGARVRGALDWLAELKDGSFEIIDYKSARTPEIDRYAFQIGVYRRAVMSMFHKPARAGLLFLGAERPEPRWLDNEIDFEAPLEALVSCRLKGEFPMSQPSHCRNIGCGFFHFCHDDESQSREDSLTE